MSGPMSELAEHLWTRPTLDYVTAVAWSSDGAYLASTLGNGLVEVRALQTGAIVATFMTHVRGALGLNWRPGTHELATCGLDRSAHVWDALTGRRIRLHEGGGRQVEHVVWRPDGAQLATGSGRHLRLWGKDGGLEWEFAGHEGTVNALVWSQMKDRLFTATNGGLRLCHAGAAQPPFALLGAYPFVALAVRRAEDLVAAALHGGSVLFWSVKGDIPPVQTSVRHGRVRALAWSPSHKFLCANGGDLLTFWRFPDARADYHHRFEIEGHVEMVGPLAFHPHADLLASADAAGLVLLTRPVPGTDPERLLCLQSAVTALQWSPSGDFVALGSEDGRIACCRLLRLPAASRSEPKTQAMDDIPF
ncbi:MAG: hypothetical protein FJ379_01585 [Verrucomicrobia bacterium]|nr:hypothetical protein [Verrucomicrobiota bacterium]